MSSKTKSSSWLILAVASGACAAFNGVFAKLVINTSANFMITAILGLVIFSESLPTLWWLGAALLVAGSVIIGRREEGDKKETEGIAGSDPLLNAEGEAFRDEEQERDDVELDSVKDGDKSSDDDDDGVLK
ncbi:hypothetical protein SLS60_011998 [Paraconiothyrium brasiliense]|uniref:EamA domain-containing protein n=1 Tax=Paraconiothyrium brasiliense TaxID=300254 RepID=A0ABR3QGV4_9PLEO